jgi:16S rRNA (guanine966-N2)-methyltransferase
MKRAPGKLRIIGGEFRSRIVGFEAAPGLRATPDRVRQTLFDWLAPVIEGARCLDLFAGSGALGLEALSRGAAQETCVESAAPQAAAIRAAQLAQGAAERAEVRNEDALAFVAAMPVLSSVEGGRSHAAAFDVVFLDPPFASGLLAPALAALPRVLAPGARVYAEWPAGAPAPWPAGYAVLREKKAGQVSYALATTGTGA